MATTDEATNLKAAAADTRPRIIRQLVQDCFQRRSAGEDLPDAAIVAEHLDLMPELGEELAKLKLLEAAWAAAEKATSTSASTSPGEVPTSTPLCVRCPHCHNPTGIVPSDSLADITCSQCGTPFSLVGSDAASSPNDVNRRIGRFEVVEQIGVGGFGVVWKARDPQLDRFVALKVPRRGQLGLAETEQFFREARATAQLRHPNIVSVHEVGRADDRVYITSDLVEGPSLAEWNAGNRMSAREAAAFCQKVALALAHAHTAGIVHRDLKPANILLDAEGSPHLTDFGLASRQAFETTVTLDGQLLGTPAYMSPEQARGEAHRADPRSDIFALGVILYELLTGELPFRGSIRMMLKQILEDEPASPRSLNSVVPRDLATICLKCMEKDPARRYATATELADDLGRFVRGEPIIARPVGRVERTWRWCRRNPRVAGLSATVAALLLVVATVTTYSSIRSRAAAREARWQQYLSDMHAAMKLWEEGSTNEVLNLLQRHQPTAGEDDLRAFEWYYLWKQVRSALDVPTLQQNSGVFSAGISLDGKVLATGDWMGLLTLWDLGSRRVLATRQADRMYIGFVVFSPDRETVATGSSSGMVKLWRADGVSEPRALEGHRGQVAAVEFSPDGKWLATGGEDRTVIIWNVATGERQQVLRGHEDLVALLVWKSSNRLLAAGKEGRIREWDLDTGQPLRELAQLPPRIVMGVLSPDKSTLAVSCTDGVIRLLDPNDGTLRDALAAHATGTRDIRLSFSPDGRLLASGGSDNQVFLWDLPARRIRDRFRGHSAKINAVIFTPDGRWLVTAGADRAIRLWDITSSREQGTSDFAGHGLYVLQVAFDPRGKWLASAAADGTVRVWDIATGEARNVLDGGTDWITSLASSPRDALVAGACKDGRLTVWNAETGVPLWTHQDADQVWQKVAFSPNGRVLLRASQDDRFEWVDAFTGEHIGRFTSPLAGAGGFAASADGTILAVPGARGSVVLAEPQTGRQLQVLEGHGSDVHQIHFSRDGRLFSTIGGDAEVRIWDIASGRVLHTLRQAATVNSVTFSPDGRILATAGSDNHIRLWDVAKGEVRATLTGHKGWVESVVFSPDGLMLASASDDRTVRLWRAASPEETDTPAAR